MRIVVELLTSDLATVVIYPSWWRWLFLGERTRECFVERIPSISGRHVWIHDNERSVELAVQAAIDREVAQNVSRATRAAR